MIYFLEHDSGGNIYHAACYPTATIVPLVNVVSLKNADGTPKVLAEPVGITADTYNTLIADGISNYTFDATTGKITKKAVTPSA
ncbi:hypothetical protein [Edaphobacter modestus]|uniref:Uncharacterized protein n=1 Tax=Edaphobacter modestus TaxID=388466 RepID=A0A4Q7YPJ5_9BACT|nr:hypothetical protein [Edaphobacter modestus]RZU39318.1 hypothetical protein BDD14_0687 [Edaphobacter modestus]